MMSSGRATNTEHRCVPLYVCGVVCVRIKRQSFTYSIKKNKEALQISNNNANIRMLSVTAKRAGLL